MQPQMAPAMSAAATEVSDDGQALVVHRFDVDADGQAHWGMEDFCALLGLRPAAKYDTTWERIARAVRDHVPGPQRLQTYRQLATTLLLTYALRNADCHAKNLALLYTRRADAHLSPAYDMLTTSVYAGYQHNPPGIEFMGKKTWTPGKNLQKFIAATFGIPPREQQQMVQAISDALADVGPLVRQAMLQHPGFADIGKRMLLAWAEGVQGLCDQRVYAVGDWAAGARPASGRAARPRSAARSAWGRRADRRSRRRAHPPCAMAPAPAPPPAAPPGAPRANRGSAPRSWSGARSRRPGPVRCRCAAHSSAAANHAARPRRPRARHARSAGRAHGGR